MKKTIAAILAITFAASAYASCRTYTYTVNGRTYYCQECCYGSGSARTCNTTCN